MVNIDCSCWFRCEHCFEDTAAMYAQKLGATWMCQTCGLWRPGVYALNLDPGGDVPDRWWDLVV